MYSDAYKLPLSDEFMWIKTTRSTDNGDPLPRALNRPELSKRVEFSDNGKAQVPKADGEFLVSEYEHMEVVEADDSDDSGGDGNGSQ